MTAYYSQLAVWTPEQGRVAGIDFYLPPVEPPYQVVAHLVDSRVTVAHARGTWNTYGSAGNMSQGADINASFIVGPQFFIPTGYTQPPGGGPPYLSDAAAFSTWEMDVGEFMIAGGWATILDIPPAGTVFKRATGGPATIIARRTRGYLVGDVTPSPHPGGASGTLGVTIHCPSGMWTVETNEPTPRFFLTPMIT